MQRVLHLIGLFRIVQTVATNSYQYSDYVTDFIVLAPVIVYARYVHYSVSNLLTFIHVIVFLRASPGDECQHSQLVVSAVM